MLLTYNQIIKVLNDFADAHYQINSFGSGDIWEAVEHNLAQGKDFHYPLMWVQNQQSTSTKGEFELNLRVYFMNLVHKDESNENEVLSDMLQVALELVSWWENQNDYPLIKPNLSHSMDSFTEKFQDELSGWWVDLKLKIPIRYNKCSIPMDGMTPIPPAGCPPVGSFTYDVFFDGVDTGTDVVIDGSNIDINLS